MKECLNCNKNFNAKRDSAKYCSDNCRVQWNRKNPKKEKGLSELRQMKVMYNLLIEKIDKISFATNNMQIGGVVNNDTPTMPVVEYNPIFTEPIKKIQLKRTPAHWVELRRDCQNSDDYAKWLVDLENDPFLTTLEKKQIKATV